MRPRSVAVLVALGIIAVAGGWYFGTATTPSERTTVASGGLMFPGLASRLQDAAKVEITHQDARTVIEKRPDRGWGIASMHDYPVQETKLRGMLTALTELRLAEPRTSDPAEFARLGVDDPNAKGSTADLLRVLDTNDKPILAVVVGHRRVRSQVNVPEEVYVRRPDDAQTWLAEGSLQVDADASLWLDRDLLNIGHDRIASVTATRADPAASDQVLVFAQADGKFVLTQPAEHPKLEEYRVDDVARALELLTFQAVKADADVPGQEVGHAVFTTSDGLVVKVSVLHADKDVWARFAVTGTDKVKAEADRLSGRLSGWTYQIGSWKEKSLVPVLDDLKAEEPAKPAAQATSTAPTTSTTPKSSPSSAASVPGAGKR